MQLKSKKIIQLQLQAEYSTNGNIRKIRECTRVDYNMVDIEVPTYVDDNKIHQWDYYRGKLSEIMNTLFKKDRKPDWSNIKTVYFTDGCRIPRFKLKGFYSKYGIRAVRNLEKADAIIVGNTHNIHRRNSILTPEYYSHIESIKDIRNAISITHYPYSIKKLVDVLDEIESNKEEGYFHEHVLCDYTLMDFLGKNRDNYDGNFAYMKICDEDMFDFYTDNEAKLVHESYILKDMGGTIMDYDMYNNICDMLSSENRADQVLAMELMANCNYSESILYLLEIMRRYYRRVIDDIVPEKRHVSFRSLKEYLNIALYGDAGMDCVIEALIDHNALTESNYYKLLDLIKLYYKEKIKENNYYNNNLWEPTEIDLVDEYKKQVIWDKKPEVEELLKLEA